MQENSGADIPGFRDLANLEFVDASVFVGASDEEQAVCDFILALALVYNDLKDLLWAFVELKGRTPTEFKPNAQVGQLNGMREHSVRLLYALHHELFQLIGKNPEPQGHQLFRNVLARVSSKARDHWARLVAAAAGKPKNDPLAMILVRVRDDLAAHYYGTKTLGRGFGRQYDGSGPWGRRLFVSRGVNIIASRFHFADGAAQGAMVILADGKTKAEIGDRLGASTQDSLNAIFAIVTRFMEDRAGGWTKYEAD